jgi:L-seryl-tRNA(Ser) seleniumtransferase
MADASQWCVDVAELQGKASEIISEITGSEAGYVTSGASAALMLGTAALLAGLDPSRMNRLPNTVDIPNEIIVSRSQRNMYDHAIVQAGAKLIEIGIADRFSGAGVRDTQAWEYEAAISERTAGIFWVAQPHSEPALPEVVAVAKRRGIPVIVDAAGQLPPISNLRRFIAEGADLVAFSGGKAIGGPQASGILIGRRHLIQSAALQQLDHDTYFDQWNPPANLVDKSKLLGLPASGIGRVAKCGKEEIVGLLTALRIFVSENPEDRHQRWLAACREISAGLEGLPGTTVKVIERTPKGIPIVEFTLNTSKSLSAAELVKQLQNGDPSVHAGHSRIREDIVIFGPTCLRLEDCKTVVSRVREVFGQ